MKPILALSLSILASCSGALEASTDHWLVGVWNPEDETNPDWDELLGTEEASFSQMIVLEDGRFIHGGLILGHPLTMEYTWEIVEESDHAATVRTTRSDGRVDDMRVLLEGGDTLVLEGPESMRIAYRRV